MNLVRGVSIGKAQKARIDISQRSDARNCLRRKAVI